MVTVVAACVAGAAGCAASGESSTTEGTEGRSRSTDGLEEAVIEEPRSALLTEQVCALRAQPQAMDAANQPFESIGEVTEDLTPQKWRELCTLGCAVLAGAGCYSVTASCTAGAVWSFGGVLIPCAYAVAAACTGSISVTTVCSFKCAGL